MKFQPTIYNLFLVLTTILLFSCSKKNYSWQSQYQFKSESGIPDYANLNYWAAHPWKKDLSDSVPKPIQNNNKNDSLADVFFLYPTTLTDEKDSSWNAKIDDANLNAKTDYSTILFQATAFNENTRVFSPRYRQAHIRTFYLPAKDMQPYFDLAYEDLKTAFEYYLQHYNNGRPIIIASHSQGTKHAGRLMKEFFDNKPLQKQLVCAYIIGLPVPENYFTTIPSCSNPDEIGCYVNWRTYKRGYIEPNFIAKENFKVIVTNPLTWTSNPELVPRTKAAGAVLLNFNKIIPKVVDANIHNNILWVCKPHFFGNFLYTKKNYHIADINLFYLDIRKNVKERIAIFLRK